MAKRKASKAAPGKAAAPPPRDEREWIVSIKGSPEFRDWLYELADQERMTAVQLIERAVVEYARNVKFPKPAPKRTK